MKDDSARDRDDTLLELVERFLAEEPADVEAFLRAHPEHAVELRRILATIGELDEAARGLGEESARDGDMAPSLELPLHSSRTTDFLTAALARIEAHGYRPGRFQKEHELSRGGQGVVLAAWDETLQRRLAMKVALAPTSSNEHTPSRAVSLGRFLEEAQVTAQLDHPGIVPVHDLGLDPEGRVYFTMKLVKGRDLRAIYEQVRLGEEGWNRTRALGVLLKVCEAMAYAHSKGVIHRDLKPANVMVGKFGEVYVMDWGLARVLGKEDRKDVRIRPEATEQARSLRHESAAGELDSPLVTMDGDVVGTPAFMSPEQARGELEAMGPHSDVYAVGAMLYQLLTGTMPYATSGSRLSARAIWALVQKGPPETVHELAPDVPPELEAICDKAMAREVTRRYADMRALADDLRAYLEHRVVLAHQTGALVELQKWVQRNKALATSLAAGVLAVVIGLVSSLVLKAQSDANAVRAASERADVLRLSALQKVQDLTDEAEALWPAWPDKIEAYDDWLARARALLLELEPDRASGSIGHRARLAELEARALPYTDEERAEDRSSHPRFPELAERKAKLDSLRKARAVREGSARVEEPVIEEALLAAGPLVLDNLAWALVTPDRTRFGEEARGLALARLAVAGQSSSPLDRALHLRTLSWACQVCGQDEEALAAGQEALDTAPEEFGPVFQWNLHLLRTGIDAAASAEPIAELEREIANLETELARRRSWRFASDADHWWHAQLSTLVSALEELADPASGLLQGLSGAYGRGIASRRQWAQEVEALTVTGAEVSRLWASAIASIADPTACPAYHGLTITPQLDLVPIGRDPRSGLWEFAHPLTGEVPARDAAGNLDIGEETGLVLVLIPGGTFFMGAQGQDPSGTNYDPDAQTDSSLSQQTVAPFFLSKYEMTQGQWHSLTGRYPSYYNPSFFSGWYFTAPFTRQHPVEKVSWIECLQVCRRMGMTLPNEAQWEYAARAGTTTVWWTGNGRDSLIGAVNLADHSAGRFPEVQWEALEDWPELDDGYPAHAPVGSYRPNPFGLHDTCGNVQEWCRNAYDASNMDPALEPSVSRSPALRGGAFQFGAFLARSAHRKYASAESANHTIGLRPARELHGEVRQRPDERTSK